MDLATRKDGPWTFDDLYSLPQEDGWRYEIVDGGLVMTPGPGIWHESVSDRLRATVRSRLPAGFEILGPINLELPRSYRIPDLAVVRNSAIRARKTLASAEDVLLVVELVSPGSQTTDRVTKPAQYAAAGIPAYWRVETEEDVSLTAYILEEGATVYSEIGTWEAGQTARLERPFAVEIEIDALSL